MWIALQIAGAVLAALVVFLVLFTFLSKSGKRARALLNLPVVAVTALVEGERAKLVGRVALGPGGPIIAPVGQRPVVAYKGFLSFWSPGLSRRYMNFQRVTAFVLETADGDLLVEPGAAVFPLRFGDTLTVEWSDAAEWMDDMLTRDGLQFDRQRARSERIGRFEMAETVIESGTMVALVGVAGRNAEGELIVRADPTLGLALSTDPDIARAPEA